MSAERLPHTRPAGQGTPPGFYPTMPQGHALLVGTNDRELGVLDLHGVVSIASVEVSDPDVLARLADHLHTLAARLRARTTRCAAAHREDPRPCDGPEDAVRVVDASGAEQSGCVLHAAVVLASVTDARVYPGSVEGAAIEAHKRAQGMRPFDFGGSA